MKSEKSLFQNDLTGRIADFLNQIGLAVERANLSEQTFLPGILVKNGRLLVDEDKLTFPGDLLHEAGHLAVAPAGLRKALGDEIFLPETEPDLLEMQAILWSFAACLHLGIDPRVVFHAGGYRGKSEALLLNFELGIYPGLNRLEESGFAFSPVKAAQLKVKPFPAMRKWLRD